MGKSKKSGAKSSSKPKKPKKRKPGSGGKRAGAGRKRERLPEQKLKDIGPMPSDPLKVAEWGRKLNGIVLEGLAAGLAWQGLSKHVDRNLRTTMELVELEIQSKALTIRGAEKDDAGKMTPRKEGTDAQPLAGALRRDPS